MLQPMLNSAPVLFDDDAVSSTSTSIVPAFNEKNVDEHTVAQALLSVHRFLKQTKCDEAAEKLRQEIDKKKLIPGRLNPFDSQGNHCLESSFDRYQRTHENVVDFLPIIHRLNQYAQKDFPLSNSISKIRLTNNAPNLSITRTTSIPSNQPSIATSFHPSDIDSMRTADLIKAVRFGRTVCSESMVSRELKTNIRYYTRVMGHVSPVYCVTFDRTGEYVITGADDNLIKVWDIRECLLRFTYRGHYGELTDLSVSHDNRYLASGSNDKTVRIWSLQDGSVVDVMMHHKGPISSVAFLPFFEGKVRYLSTASYDCSIFFYRYDADTFQQLGSDHFPHKDGGPGKIVTSATSAGGKFAAFSDTRKNIFIYKLSIDGVELVEALQNTHNDKVDSLAFAFTQLRLLSSSADGILKFWDYKCKKWRATEAKLPDELMPKQTLPIINGTGTGLKKNKYGVLTLAWSTDDRFAISTGTDHVIRIWDPITANLVKSLTGHERTIFLIRPHPTDSMFFITGSHDGQVMLWDLRDFSLVKKFKNESHAFDDKSDSILDFSFSPNGLFSAFVDEAGCVTFMGISKNEQLKLVPKQQFFHSDYMPCANDERNFTTDLTTNLAPHLNNPPILIQMENIPHEDKWQRKIPGRSKLLDAPEELYPEGYFCAWKNMDIAPRLKEYQTEKIKREHLFYGSDLLKLFELENNKEPPENWDQNDKPRKAVKRTIRRNADTLPPPIILLAETDSEDLTYSEGSDSSRTPSEDELPNENNLENEENDSDYYEGYQGHDTVFRNHNRRRRRRDDDGDQNEVESPPLPRGNDRPVGRPRRIRRERRQDDIQPGPSRQRTNANSLRRSTRANPAPPEEEQPQRSRGRRRNQRPEDNQNHVQHQDEEQDTGIESPPESLFANRGRAVYPTWMVEFKRRRFPFVAQLGDRIVYFPQGHLIYLEKCRKLKLIKSAKEYRPKAEFNSQEFAVVDNIQYLIVPYRCTELTLGLTDDKDRRTGKKFVVKYHDLQDFPDFMVHRDYYDTSVRINFQEGDQVEAIIDDKWWTGRVEERKYHNQGEYNNSQFNSVVVKWSNNDPVETCSPWELQKLTIGRQNETLVTEDEQDKFGNIMPRLEDWPIPDEAFPADDGRVSGTRAREYFCEKLRNALNELTAVDGLAEFEYPVDLSKYENYYDVIPYPMDLQTLNERLCNSYYRTMQHLKSHIQLLAVNACEYNEETSIIAKNSKALVETLFRVLEDTQVLAENAALLFETLRLESVDSMTAWARKLGYSPSRTNTRRSRQSGDVEMEESTSRNVPNRNEPIWIEESIASCNQEIEQSLKEAIGENELADIIGQLRAGVFEGPENFLHHLIQQIEYAVSHSEDRRSSRQLNLLITKLNRRFANIKDKYNRMVREQTTRAARNSSMILRENRKANQLRRSSRRHGEVNYAELANGIEFTVEKSEYKSGRSTRNAGKSKSVERKPSVKNESDDEKQEDLDEESFEIPPQPMNVSLFEDDNLSSPSNDGQDSDYQAVEEQDAESENEVDIPIDPDDKPSTESESTAKSTTNSSRSTPAPRRQSSRRTRKRPRKFSDSDTTEENQPKSKRKSIRKKKTTTRATPHQTRTIAATRTRRNANRINYRDDDDDDEFDPPPRQSGRRLAPRN